MEKEGLGGGRRKRNYGEEGDEGLGKKKKKREMKWVGDGVGGFF